MKYLIYILTTLSAISCERNLDTKHQVEDYDGPVMELENVAFYYSDMGQIKMKGTTPHRMEYADGNQDFPKGLYLELYDEAGKIKSTIKANKAYFNKTKDEWLGQEDVIVINTESGQQLNTEELFWLPADKKIYTEKFVTIKKDDEILHGRGLEATEDLSTYSITNPAGEFLLEENPDL